MYLMYLNKIVTQENKSSNNDDGIPNTVVFVIL